MCHTIISNHEYNFLSLVSSNTCVNEVFFNVVKDIGLEVEGINETFLTKLKLSDNLQNTPICALCFKRFCDYDQFSVGLKDLKTSFKNDIEMKLNDNNFSFQSISSTDTIEVGKNKENKRIVDAGNRKHISNRKCKKPSRFEMKGDQSITTVDNLEPQERSQDIDNPFRCEVCQKGFTRKASMQEHLARHKGKEQFCYEIDQLFIFL